MRVDLPNAAAPTFASSAAEAARRSRASKTVRANGQNSAEMKTMTKSSTFNLHERKSHCR